MTDVEKMQTALQIIASWDDAETDRLDAGKLREVLRSMVAVATEALEPSPQFPWQ